MRYRPEDESQAKTAEQNEKEPGSLTALWTHLSAHLPAPEFLPKKDKTAVWLSLLIGFSATSS